MTCGHRQIRTWVFEDTQQPSGLWSCVDCGLKFEPITQRTWVWLTDEEIGAILEDPTIAEKHQGNWLVLPYSYARAVEAKLKEKNQ